MDVKITLPLLPLRDIVVFPSMVIPLFVGRDKSISALNEVMKKDKKIILVTQKNSEIDDPKKTDIFMHGCEGSILQLLKLPDGTVKILVEGLQRASLEEVIIDKGYFAHIQKIEEQIEDSKYERDLLATIKNQFTEFVSVSKKVSFEIINQVQSMASLSKVVDVIS